MHSADATRNTGWEVETILCLGRNAAWQVLADVDEDVVGALFHEPKPALFARPVEGLPSLEVDWRGCSDLWLDMPWDQDGAVKTRETFHFAKSLTTSCWDTLHLGFCRSQQAYRAWQAGHRSLCRSSRGLVS
eukprot:3361650-Rhodomonas_salina.2